MVQPASKRLVTEATIKDPTSAPGAYLSSTFALKGEVPKSRVSTVGQDVAANLDMGVGSTVITVLGDSTGNDNFEWVRLFATHLAARYTGLRVLYTLWSDANQNYPAATVVQAGTTPSGGLTTTVTDNFNRTAAEMIGTTPQSGGAWQGTTGRFSLNGTKMVVNAAGLAHAYGTQTGSKMTTTARGITIDKTGAATVRTLEIGTKAVDTANHLFLTLSVPTGSGLTWSIWQRVGSTATKLVDGPTTAGAGAITFDASITVDGLNVSATVNGGTASTTITQATADALANGNGLTLWAKNTDIAGTTIDSVDLVVDVPVVSGPSVTIYNGSMPGSTLAYQSTRIAAMVPVAPNLVVLSSSHNYNGGTAADYLTAVRQFVTDLRAVYASVPVLVCSQNPEFSDGGRAQSYVDAHKARLAALRPEAVKQGWGYVPVMEAFLSQPNGGRAWVMADGIHPQYDPTGPNDGSQLWVKQVNAYFDSMSLRTDLPAG